MTSDSVVSNEMVMDFSSSHLPWRLDVGRHEALRRKTRSLGEFWAVGCALGGISGRRSATELRRTEGEYLGVLLVRKGSEIFTQNDKTALVGEGCAVIWDGVKSAAGNRYLYARAPRGSTVELVSYPSSQAYEAGTQLRRWRPSRVSDGTK